MKRHLGLLVVSVVAALLAAQLSRWAGYETPQPELPVAGQSGSSHVESKLPGQLSPWPMRADVAPTTQPTVEESSLNSDNRKPNEATTSATPQPGYLFDLDAVRELLNTGLVPIENHEGRIISSLDVDEIVEDLRGGFDEAQVLYEGIMSADPLRPHQADARAMAWTWELVSAVLPESANLLSSQLIRAALETGSYSTGVHNFADLPHGDLTMVIKGPRWMLTLTIPHNVGPRSIWRQRYEFERTNGSLPSRMYPSSIPAAGTLSLTELFGEAK